MMPANNFCDNVSPLDGENFILDGSKLDLLELENFWIYPEEKEDDAQHVPDSTLDLNGMPEWLSETQQPQIFHEGQLEVQASEELSPSPSESKFYKQWAFLRRRAATQRQGISVY